MYVPDVSLGREDRSTDGSNLQQSREPGEELPGPGSPSYLPDIREGDHADHKQEGPEVRDLLWQHFVLSQSEHGAPVSFVSIFYFPTSSGLLVSSCGCEIDAIDANAN